MTLSPPSVNDWLAAAKPAYTDFNTCIRDTFSFLANPPVFRASAVTFTQSVANNTWAGIELDTVAEDTYSGWQAAGTTGNNYQAQVPGWYAVTWTVFAPVGVGYLASAGLQFVIAGTILGPFDMSQAEGGGLSPWGWDCYTEVHLNTGDAIYPYFRQLTGSPVTTTAGSSLEITWVSE